MLKYLASLVIIICAFGVVYSIKRIVDDRVAPLEKELCTLRAQFLSLKCPGHADTIMTVGDETDCPNGEITCPSDADCVFENEHNMLTHVSGGNSMSTRNRGRLKLKFVLKPSTRPTR